MRFLADHMLGSLARWMRFLGFDCAYPEVLPDKDLIDMAKREERVILTRDKDLARVKDIKALYFESTDLDKQLVHIIDTFHLKIENPFSRCSVCNSKLIEVDKRDVEGKVPKKVFAWRNEFLKCEKCQKYYWQGTHFEEIKDKIEKLERKAP
ncbi:MAG: Mut7-C RNAse domain-containing protein [Thermoplasmata archaeon]|nr:MAG: Mut7-C RNAse domain-containing protein [Thermoplasmata archaeon]